MKLMSVCHRVICIAISAATLSLASCASSEPPAPSQRARCEAVRDHVVELQLAQAQAGGADLTEALADAHRAAMVATLGDAYLDDCEGRGAAWVACAGGAATAADVGACGEVTP